MTVKEVAETLDIPAVKVKELLGKARADSVVTEEELEILSKKLEEGPATLAFISLNRKHTISIPFDEEGNAGKVAKIDRVEMLKFEDFRCLAKEGGVAHTTIMTLHGHGIMIHKNEPFTSLKDKTAFRKMLKEKVLTGINDEPATDSGLAFLHAWLKDDEKERATNILMHEGGYEALIGYVADNKSYTHV